MRTTGSAACCGIGLALAWAVCLAGCGAEGAGGEPQELLARGWRAYSTGDWDIALASFEPVAEAPEATDELRFSALLGLATTHHMQPSPDLARASAYYEQLGHLGAAGAERAGLLGLALIARAQRRTDQCVQMLERIRREWPDSVEADEATLHLAETLFAPTESREASGGWLPAGERDVQRGVEVLEDWLARKPANPLASAMHRTLADKYIRRDEPRVAISHLERALERGIMSARTRSTVLWTIARTAELELKDYELAQRYYERFIEVSRRHVLYYRATQSLERVRRLLDGGAS